MVAPPTVRVEPLGAPVMVTPVTDSPVWVSATDREIEVWAFSVPTKAVGAVTVAPWVTADTSTVRGCELVTAAPPASTELA